MTETYAAKRASETVNNLREAYTDVVADLNGLMNIDWSEVDQEKLEGLLPLLDTLDGHKNNVILIRVTLRILEVLGKP